MKGREFIGPVDQEGRLPRTTALAIQALLRDCRGKTVKVTLSIFHPKMSDKQRGFIHGPFIHAITEMFWEAGNEWDDKMSKDFLKTKFGPLHVVKLPDGTKERQPKPSGDWTTKEASEVMEKARAWAAQYGFSLPFPNEGAAR